MNKVYSQKDGNILYWYSNGLVFKMVIGDICERPREDSGENPRFTTKWFKPYDPTHEIPILHRCASDGSNVDLPAVEYANGDKSWWVNGLLHRDNGLPAIVRAYANNETHLANPIACREWYVNGKLHRDNDLPALEWINGDKQWWVNGNLHRDNGLPAIVHVNGDKEWWINGHHHRIDGPAIERANGDKLWVVDDKHHRDNGLPAIE